jgi:metallopeptidase MepB
MAISQKPPQEAKKLLADAETDFLMRDDIFQLVRAVASGSNRLNLDLESQYLVDNQYRKFLQNGSGISEAREKERFKQVQIRLQDLVRQCCANLNGDSSGIWLTPEELSGAPNDFLHRLKKGDGEDEGNVWLTFKVPDTTPALTYARNSETRKRIHLGNENRMSQNGPLLREIVLLRDESARLLGYANHASFKTTGKMVKTPETVNSFLVNLQQQLQIRGRKEVEELLRLKLANDEENPAEKSTLYLWDRLYYRNIVLRNTRDVDPDIVSEYFSLERTLLGMFNIYAHIFGIYFNNIKGQVTAWHEDVIPYAMWDDEGGGRGFLGYLYCDLYPREAKFSHGGHYCLSHVRNE